MLDTLLLPGERALIQQLMERRQAGEPLAYLLGHRDFYGRRFWVGPGVLIPRSDTEALVDQALACLSILAPQGALSDDARPDPVRVLELGTGSGCIGISLWLTASARGRTPWITLTDQSPRALCQARHNALWHGADLSFALGNWFEALASKPEPVFDLIISNPPYVAAADPHLDVGDLRHEPMAALAGLRPNPDGLADIRQICAQAGAHLRPGGFLLLEHGHDQQAAVLQLLQASGFESLRAGQDLAGRPRWSCGSWPKMVTSE